MSELTDKQIVQDLVDIGGKEGVSAIEQDVWLHMSGYIPMQGFELNRKYGVGTRTLQKWARAVRIKIVIRRELLKSGRVKFGHTIAEGSRTRFAADSTPQGRVPGSSWSEERLRAQYEGTDRKAPARVPPTRKRA